MNWTDQLAPFSPCEDAITWANQYPTAQAAWDSCERGDWMFWFAAKIGLTPERHRQLVLAVCQIVRRQLHNVPADEHRPLAAIEAAETWAEVGTEAETTEAVKAAWGARAAAEEAEAARTAWARAEYKVQADIVRSFLTCPDTPKP